MAVQRHLVTVEPRGIEFDADDDETIMAAAQRSGYRWPTLCHGDATCSICWAEVLAGDDRLSEMGAVEEETLELVPRLVRATRTVRLACRARVRGEVRVRKAGVKPAAD